MDQLYSNTVPVHRLSEADLCAMWSLYDQYYSQATRTVFEKDLSEKSHVILLRDRRSHNVQGFSTLHFYPAQVEGARFFCLYSGDTIVAREYWGQNALQKAFLRFMVRCKLSHPFATVYWLLISKGYKTYLLLSRNFPAYWPRHDKPTPVLEKGVLDTLAAARFGHEYLADQGLVRHEICPGKLRESVAPIDEELRRQHRDIDFFATVNPGHSQGDELCCLGLVSPSQWAFYLLRLIRKRLRRVFRPISSKSSKEPLTVQSCQP